MADNGVEMKPDPFDVPWTEEGRDEVRRRVEELWDKGDSLELGLGLTRLSRLVFQVGSWDDGSAFGVAATIADRAIEVLRRIGDKQALAAALRARAVPFVQPDIVEECLNEALSLSREIGDRAGEAAALFRLSKASIANPRPDLLSEAETIYQELDDACGIAVCLMARAFQDGPREDRDRVEKATRAAHEYERGGDVESAYRTRMIANMFSSEATPYEERKANLVEAVRLARATGDLGNLASVYRSLSNLGTTAGRPDDEAHFSQLEDELDEPLYGGREGRLRADIANLEEVLDVSTSRHKREVNRKIKALRKELSALEDSPPQAKQT
jgi:hypothetical protein